MCYSASQKVSLKKQIPFAEIIKHAVSIFVEIHIDSEKNI